MTRLQENTLPNLALNVLLYKRYGGLYYIRWNINGIFLFHILEDLCAVESEEKSNLLD